MRVGAVAAKRQIPVVAFFLHAQLFDAALQDVQPLLTLAAANQFPDAGHQDIDSGHRFAVVIQAHVEGLDVLGIVVHADRPAEVFFRQIALVLRLQVHAPADGELELFVRLEQDVDGVRVGHPGKAAVLDVVEPLQQSLVHKLVEEFQFFRRMLHHVGNDIADHFLGQRHVVKQIGEGDFRLDHPEFRGVALGVALFRAEGRAEGIDVAEGGAEGFHVQLAGNRQAGGLAEKVLGKVHLSVLRAGRIGGVQGRHPEHFARALGVAGGDQRGMHVDKVLLSEESVNRLGRQRADLEHGVEGVRPRTEMGLGAQVFKGVALFLQRIVRRAQADHFHAFRVQLKGLFELRRPYQRPFHVDRAAQGNPGNIGVIRHGAVADHLQVLKEGTVVHFDEGEGVAGADRAYPAADTDFGAVLRRFPEQGPDRGVLHLTYDLSV